MRAVEVTFSDTSLRSCCLDAATMTRRWGTAADDVALCLSALIAAETLADLETLRALVVKPVPSAAARSSKFTVATKRARLRISARSTTNEVINVPTDTNGLSSVRALEVTNIACQADEPRTRTK
jgi:hypothetical protein